MGCFQQDNEQSMYTNVGPVLCGGRLPQEATLAWGFFVSLTLNFLRIVLQSEILATQPSFFLSFKG